MFSLRKVKSYCILFVCLWGAPVCFAQPAVEVAPERFDLQFNTGENHDRELTVSNRGDEGLSFRLTKESAVHPLREGRRVPEIGAELDGFRAPYTHLAGMAWDGGKMWFVSYERRRLFSVDPATYEVADDFETPVRCLGMTCLWDDELLLTGGEWDSQTAYLFDKNGDVVATHNFDRAVNGGFAFDGEFIYWNSEGDSENPDDDRLYKLARDFEVAGAIPGVPGVLNHSHALCMDYVQAHEHGNFWIMSSDGVVSQVKLDFENGEVEVVDGFYGRHDNRHNGLAHDGENLWCGGAYESADVYFFDDGYQESHWLSFDPSRGAIEGGEETAIEFRFNTSGLSEGEYSVAVLLQTNDPQNLQVSIPVSLEINDAPDISVLWNEAAGYPHLIYWNDVYEDLIIDDAYDIDITVINEGFEILEIEDVEFDNGLFMIEDGQFDLDPGEDRVLTVTFNADRAGFHQSALTIHSNDPDEEVYEISLAARCGSAPEIELDPPEIDEELFTGGGTELPVRIINNGGVPLRWETEIDFLAEPERDAFGGVIDRFVYPAAPNGYRKAGLSWDGDHNWMWISCYESDKIAAVDPSMNYRVRRQWSTHNPMDNAYLNGILYQIPWSNDRLDKWNTEGELVGTVELGYRPTAVAADPETEVLLIICENSWRLHVLDVNDDYRQIIQYDVRQHIEGNTSRSIAWSNSHPEGQLWLNYHGRIYLLEFDTSDWRVTNSQVMGNRFGNEGWDGIGHDGHNLWLGSRVQAEIEIWADGNPDYDWIALSPEHGTAQPRGEDEAALALDASNLVAGEYEADIVFTSNDPENPETALNILLRVESEANLEVFWGAERGYPESVDWNLQTPDLYAGNRYEMDIRFNNSGWDHLMVDDIEFDNEDYSIESTDFVLQPQSDTILTVGFMSREGEPGENNATMTVFSNDPDDPEYTILFEAVVSEPPAISVEPDEIVEEAVTGDLIRDRLTASNQGGSPLVFDIRKETILIEQRDNILRNIRRADGGDYAPHRDDLGDIIAQFEFPYDQVGGLAWDGENIWGTSYNWARLFCIDRETFDVVCDFPIESRPMGMVWDEEEGVFWISRWDAGEAYLYDREGSLTGRRNMPGRYAGIAFDGEHFYWNSEANRTLHKITREGEVVGTIPNFPNILDHGRAITLTWVDSHREGNLWVKTQGWMCRVDSDFENQTARIVNQFRINSEHTHEGITHDGCNLWTADHWSENRICRIYADGIDEVYWLTYQPESGTLQPDEEIQIDIYVNAEGLTNGENNAQLHFISNDPENPDLAVPVTMIVTGTPLLNVEWSEEAGYPDLIDFNQTYEDLFTESEYTIPIIVRNYGVVDLEVDDVWFEQDFYSSDPLEFTLEPHGEQEVTITLQTDVEEDYFDVIHLDWNSPDGDDYEVEVQALAGNPPVIALDPESLEDEVYSCEVRHHAISVGNEGDLPLRFSLNWEDDPEPFMGIRGFNGQYFHNPRGHNPAWGDLVMERVDEFIRFDWNHGAPGNGVRDDYFGVRWTTEFYVPEPARYGFRFYTDDGIRFYIDEQRLFDRWHSGGTFEVWRDLEAGSHSLKMEMYENEGLARAHLWQRPPGINEWRYMQGYLGDPWISIQPISGAVAPDEELELEVTLTDVGLAEGEHEATLHILSNDPEAPVIEYDFTITITEEAAIEVLWDEQYGYPDVIDWNRAFDELYTGQEYAVPVQVHNPGELDLFVMRFRSEDESFTAFDRPFFLHADEEGEFEIVFSTEEAGLHEVAAELQWNSPREEDYILNLSANPTPPPQIVVEPEEIEIDLNYGEQGQAEFTIGNTGVAPLNFEIEPAFDENAARFFQNREANGIHAFAGMTKDGENQNQNPPRRDNPGQILRNYNLGGDIRQTIGLAYDPGNRLIWGVNHNPSFMYAVDPGNGQVVRRFEVENMFVSLFYLDGFLYAGGWYRNPRAIYKYDTEGRLIRRIYSPVNLTDTYLHCDGERLFTNRYGEGRVNVFDWETFEPLGEILYGQEIGLNHTRALEWIPEHPNGQLWLSGNNSRLYQFYIDENWNCEAVQNFGTPNGDHCGLAHDERDLWRAGYNTDSRLYKIDDGVEERRWFSFHPDRGSVEGDGFVEIEIYFDTIELEAGDYGVDLHINSNDPEADEAVLPVTLTVAGAPVIDVLWDQAFGYPGVIDWNRAYEAPFAGGEYPISAVIVNNGIDDLIIEEIASENDDYTAGQRNMEIPPGESREVVFTLQAAEPGETAGEMAILWNDPNGEDLFIPMTASVTPPPAAAVDPVEFETELFSGQSGEYVFNIANEGENILRFHIENELIGEPRRDEPRAEMRSIRRAGSNTERARRDNLGEIVDQINMPYVQTSGLAWDGQSMWATAYSDRRLMKIDPAELRIIQNIGLPANTIGMTYDWREELLWLGRWGSNTVYLYNLAGENVGAFNLPWRSNGDFAFDGEFFYWNSEDRNTLFKLNRDREIVGEIPNLREQIGRGRTMAMEWARKHYDGHVWVITAGWRCQLQTDFENGTLEVIREFDIENRHAHEGLAHDGENLWFGGHWDQRRGVIYDDDIDEIRWLDYDVYEGELGADEEMEATVYLDASGLEEGDYEADLIVVSNDPENPEVTLSILLTITEAAHLTAEWEEEFGYPQAIDFNRAFENVWTGSEYSIPFEIHNDGVNNVIIRDISFDRDAFDADRRQMIVEPGNSRENEVLFTADENGAYQAEMRIAWNSPDDEDYIINVRAETVSPGRIAIEPEELEETLNTGETSVQTLEVANTGEMPLEFHVNWLDNDAIWAGEPGFHGRYHRTAGGGHNPDWGDFVMERTDEQINFDWGHRSPGGGVPDDYWGAQWRGWFYAAEDGRYRFRSTSDDGVRLWIDEHFLIDRWNGGGAYEAQIDLERGVHELEFHFYDVTGPARVRFYWRPPGVEDWAIMNECHTGRLWLRVDQAETELEPDENADVFFTFDAADLPDSDLEAGIIIASNDPDAAQIELPVSLTVNGTAYIEASWSEDLGYPEAVDWNGVSEEFYPGEEYSIPVIFRNAGVENLTVTNIACENELFAAEPAEFNLEPDEETEVVFTFNAEEEVEYQTEMTVEWNSPDEEDLTIPMIASPAAPPIIEVDPREIETTLYTNETVEFAINIFNEGNSELRFRTAVEIIDQPDDDEGRDPIAIPRRQIRSSNSYLSGRDEGGDILAEFNTPYRYLGGFAWDGENIWITAHDNDRLMRMNPENRQILNNWGIAGHPMAMFWDSETGYFWIQHWSAPEVYIYDRSARHIETRRLPGDRAGLACDGEFIYCNSESNRRLYKLNRDMQVVAEMTHPRDFLDHGRCIAMEYVPKHYGGHFWFLSEQRLTQVDLDFDRDRLEVIQEFEVQNQHSHNGLCHDGANFWFGGNWDNQTGYVIDDGITECGWIDLEFDEGVLAPGEDVDMTVELTAGYLPEGFYEVDMNFYSNDIEANELTVAVMMEVVHSPFIEVEWDESAGYPASIDWNEAFLNLFTGVEYSLPVTVRNSGLQDLAVEGIAFGDEIFSADAEGINIAPGEQAEFDLTAHTEERGIYETEMTIVWNSPHDEDFVIPVEADIPDPPVIFFDPVEIADSLNAGEMTDHQVTFANDGEGPLRFEIDWLNQDEVWSGQPGWFGQYYNTEVRMPRRFIQLRMERIDRIINFDWGEGGPGGGVNANDFGVRWTGCIRAMQDGEYEFISRTDDGARLYIDDELVFESWRDQGASDLHFSVELRRGAHKAVFEHFENGGAASASLRWRPPGQEEFTYTEAMTGEPFVRVEPSVGTVEAGDEFDVTLILDAEEIEAGSYEAVLPIYANDPARPEVGLPVQMYVANIAALQVSWDEDFGYPNAIDWNNVYDRTFAGGVYPAAIAIRNNGLGAMHIESVSCENQAFEFDPGELILEPNAEAEVEILFRPAEAAEIESEIVIDWNNPDDIDFIIPVFAETFDPPEIAVMPNEFAENLDFDELRRHAIRIANAGGSRLKYTISRAGASEPEPGRDCGFYIAESNTEADVDFNFSAGFYRSIRRAERTQAEGRLPRDQAGDLVREFMYPYDEISGLAWDGELMWGIAYNEYQRIFAIDPQTFEVVHNMWIADNCIGMAWDAEEEILYIGRYDTNWIYRCDRGGRILSQFQAPNARAGVAFDGTYVYWNSNDANRCYKLTRDGAIIGSISEMRERIGHGNTYCLTYVDQHDGGSFWINTPGWLVNAKLDFGNDRVEILREFRIENRFGHEGVSHDGTNLWTGGHWDRRSGYIYDDGYLEARWLSFNPERGGVDPGEEVAVEMTLDARERRSGRYEAEVYIDSNDPQIDRVVIPVVMQVGVRPVEWTVHFPVHIATDSRHRISVRDLRLDGEPMPGNSEIGVYAPNGVFCGAGVYQGEGATDFAAYGDDPETQGIEGFRDGEEIGFVVWDEEADREYPAGAHYIIGDREFQTGGRSVVTLNAEQMNRIEVELLEGWNAVSINIVPPQRYWLREEGPDIVRMTEQFEYVDDENRARNHLLLMKDSQGRFYIPEWNFNNIPYWNLTQGYQMKMDGAQAAGWEGVPIPFDAPITLEPGWNIAAYFPSYELPADAPDFYVIADIIDRVELAKDNFGRFIITEFQFSNMAPWEPFQAYWIKITQGDPIEFRYPVEPDNLNRIAPAGQPIDRELNSGIIRTGENMSLLINEISGAESVESGRIRAYGPSGLAVGSGVISNGRCGLAVWGDDPATAAVDGLTEGESFKLKLVTSPAVVNSETDISRDESSLHADRIFTGAGLIYAAGAFTALSVSAREIVPKDYCLSQNYPNPFNSATSFKYGLPQPAEIKIAVFDLNGRLIETLASGKKQAGSHTLVWNAARASSGIYMVRFEAGGREFTRKVVLMR